MTRSGARSGGGNGPPDLDELWRNFNQKLNGLFGRRGGGGGALRYSRPSMRQLGGGAGLLVALVAGGVAGERLLHRRCEASAASCLPSANITETHQPGLALAPALSVPERTRSSICPQVRTVEVGYRNNVKTKVPKESLMLTDDENIIDIQFAVQYMVKDPLDYLFNNRHPDETVLQAAETAIREVVGKNKMDFVLYEGREQVANEAQKLMQEILDRYKTGIAISNVTMQNAQPPEQVQAAFDDAVKAGQDGAAEERGPGLRQRRGAEGARRRRRA